jgi:hypothetical protein
MAGAREFHGILHNNFPDQGPQGDPSVGVLTYQNDICDSGERTQGLEPDHVKSIPPGGQVEWATESNGIMTGTSGQLNWSIKTDTGGEREFVQINWGVPFYNSLGVHQPHISCSVTTTDPMGGPFVNPNPPPPTLECVGVRHDENGNPVYETLGGVPPEVEMQELAPLVFGLPVTWFGGGEWLTERPRVGFLLRLRTGVAASALTLAGGGPSDDDKWMASVGSRFRTVVERGFAGGFPNFYYAQQGANEVGGTIFLHAGSGQFRQVAFADMGSPALGNFGDRWRAANAYAGQQGFMGAVCTFYDVGASSGVFLMAPEAVEFRDVLWTDLASPDLDDISLRFRATQDYANNNGFAGGFPTLFHADNPGGRVCGTILIKPEFAHWEDVTVFVGPH